MTQQQIIEDITSRIASYPEETRALLYKYEIDRTPSVQAITEGYAKYGNKFLEEFANVTTKESNAAAWTQWVAAAGGALSGFANGLSAQSNAEATRELQIEQAKADAEKAKADASSKRTILYVVGAIAVVGVLVAVFFLTKKKK